MGLIIWTRMILSLFKEFPWGYEPKRKHTEENVHLFREQCLKEAKQIIEEETQREADKSWEKAIRDDFDESEAFSKLRRTTQEYANRLNENKTIEEYEVKEPYTRIKEPFTKKKNQ